MYTDPDGREITEAEVAALLWQDTHDLTDTRLGPLRIYTRWWGEEDRPWLTRAWVSGRLVGRQWSRTRDEAHIAHGRWVQAIFDGPPLPLPHPRRTRTHPAPTQGTLPDPYGTGHYESGDAHSDLTSLSL